MSEDYDATRIAKILYGSESVMPFGAASGNRPLTFPFQLLGVLKRHECTLSVNASVVNLELAQPSANKSARVTVRFGSSAFVVDEPCLTQSSQM